MSLFKLIRAFQKAKGRSPTPGELSQLKKQDTTWTVVSGHYPLSSASADKNTVYQGKTILASFLRYMSCSRVDLWLAGHAHHLEHRKLSTCNTAAVT